MLKPADKLLVRTLQLELRAALPEHHVSLVAERTVGAGYNLRVTVALSHGAFGERQRVAQVVGSIADVALNGTDLTWTMVQRVTP